VGRFVDEAWHTSGAGHDFEGQTRRSALLRIGPVLASPKAGARTLHHYVEDAEINRLLGCASGPIALRPTGESRRQMRCG